MSMSEDAIELSAYHIDNLTPGTFAVIQSGYACLGYGATPEDAIADARRCMGEDIELDSDDFDGAVQMVLIEA